MSAGGKEYGTVMEDDSGNDAVVTNHGFVRTTVLVILVACVITAMLWCAWLGYRRWRKNRIQEQQIEMGIQNRG